MATNRITCLTRPFSKRGIHYIAEHGLADKSVDFSSDWRGVEADWMMRDFYQAFRSKRSTDVLLAGMSEETVSDVVERCRYLRTLPLERSHRMVGAMAEAANALLDRQQPDLVITCHLDCYMYDVISRVQAAREKGYVAIGDTMFADYGDVNYRFLPMVIRTPSPHEIDRCIETMAARSFRPAYMVKSYYDRRLWRRFLRLYARQQLRRMLFPLRAALSGDSMNFHLRDHSFSSCRKISWLCSEGMFHDNWREMIRDCSLMKVFIPLQWYPEARYDYSTLHPQLRNLNDLALRICKLLNSGFQVVLKEHPAVYGTRDPRFYEQLRQHENVVLVPPFVHTSEVADMTDCLITMGATAGMEAAMRGQRVISISEPLYYVEHGFEVINTPWDLAELPNLLRRNRDLLSPDELAPKIASRMLSQFLPGGCPYLRFRKSNREAAAELHRFAASLNTYLETIYVASIDAANRYFDKTSEPDPSATIARCA